MINEIYKLFLDELSFIESSSYFSNQDMKNIHGCGGLIELAIRKLLREVVGERFKITHGYIYSTSKKQLSPQIDIIITDKLVSHSLKRFEYLDNLEIVPMEAVVGIFEVKRTLKKQQVLEAANHLNKVIDFVPLIKNHSAKYLPGGVELKSGTNIKIDGGKLSNPIIGIIGLLHEDLEDVNKENIPWFIDCIFSFDGYLKALKDPSNENLKIFSSRAANDPYDYKTLKEPGNKAKILMCFIAYLIQYLNEVSGRTFDINEYFT